MKDIIVESDKDVSSVLDRATSILNMHGWWSRDPSNQIWLGAFDINADKAAQIANNISTGLHKDTHSLLIVLYQLESNICAITGALTGENVNNTSKQLA